MLYRLYLKVSVVLVLVMFSFADQENFVDQLKISAIEENFIQRYVTG